MHNHIFQVKDGKPGCPACESRNPIRMTSEYVVIQKRLIDLGF